MEKMTSREFVHTFLDIWNSSDRRICFVLGAGASKSSGIRTGGELAKQWLAEIEKRMGGQNGAFKDFVQKNNIDIEFPGSGYPEIYKERFKFDNDSGFDFINREMENAKPGYGYSVLAQILSEKQHNIVITTNFDNLTEEALYTYTPKRPLICGHESLAVFAKPSVKRPLIVKIHRDRFFNPQSKPDEIDRMHEQWVNALNNIFSASTPVFIGYGGNDGSLMGYMEKVSIINNLFWCERVDAKIPDKVQKLLEKHNGKLIEIEGFDELMFMLQDGLRLKLLDTEIIEIANSRSKEYKETVERISKKLSESNDSETQEAVGRIADKAGDGWWAWELKAQAAKTNDEKERVYHEALTTLPDSAELNGNFAIFLNDIRKNYDEAEKFYRKALDLQPDDADFNSNFANFLKSIRKNYDEAEKFYRRALELQPDHAGIHGNFANFLNDIRKNYDEAEKFYRRALELQPDHAGIHGNFANFLNDIRKNYDEAEKFYRRALELQPDHANNNGNFANFLNDIRKNYDEAEKFYLRALELQPDHANNNGNFASFLKDIRNNYDEAEKHYRRALELQADDANINGNFAVFLKNIRKNYDEAEKFYRRALELQPDHAGNNGNFANFLNDIRKNYDEAEKFYRRALELLPDHAGIHGNFAVFLNETRKNYDEAEKFYRRALELQPDHANNNSNFALFLNDIRKNYDEAEKFYRRVLELQPDDANINGNFAVFLKDVRKNYDEAEKFYRRALELKPNDADFNGNFAGFLMSQNRLEDALLYWKKSFKNCKEGPLLVELWFYKYAHVTKEIDKAFAELKKLVCDKKARSIGFGLQNNVDAAIKNNHPKPQMLQLIADIITKDIPAEEFCKA